MTAGTVPVREMGTVGKELGRLEAVLEKKAAVSAKASEIRDLEEVRCARESPTCLFKRACRRFGVKRLCNRCD